MNVQEFIKTAITEIVAGVAEARVAVEEYGASAGSDKVYGYVKDNKIMTDANGRKLLSWNSTSLWHKLTQLIQKVVLVFS